MKKHIAMKWVKALRSGKYKQGRGNLRNTFNEFCCLGVLCNLHAQAHPNFAAEQTAPNAYDGHTGVLGTTVLEWSGMTTDCGDFNRSLVRGAPRNPSNTALVDLNDTAKWSFAKIATFIEKNWKVL